MTATDYPQKRWKGNRAGLHYSRFRPVFENRSLDFQSVATRKIFHRLPNPPSRAKDDFYPGSLRVLHLSPEPDAFTRTVAVTNDKVKKCFQSPLPC